MAFTILAPEQLVGFVVCPGRVKRRRDGHRAGQKRGVLNEFAAMGWFHGDFRGERITKTDGRKRRKFQEQQNCGGSFPASCPSSGIRARRPMNNSGAANNNIGLGCSRSCLHIAGVKTTLDKLETATEYPEKRLPPPGQIVTVKCLCSECLGYRDETGRWRSRYGGRELPEVLGWAQV